MLHKDDDTPQAITLNNVTYYYLTDGHGDIREITDKTGNTLVKYSYDAWGNPTTTVIASGSEAISETAKQLATINPYTYASYRYDSDTGMYYLRARYYDPVTGRFLSKDMMRAENLYPYAGNNPVNAIDASGMRLSLIQKGNKGNQVRILQDALWFLYKKYKKFKYGALNLARDGDFGPKTKAGVKKFQQIASLVPDSIVGPRTWNRLLERAYKDNQGGHCRRNVGYRPLIGLFTPPNWLPWVVKKIINKAKEFPAFAEGGIGSDCWYSLTWGTRTLPWYSVSVCVKEHFYSPNRWCTKYYEINMTTYPQICSEFLPMKSVIKWRKSGVAFPAPWSSYSPLKGWSSTGWF